MRNSLPRRGSLLYLTSSAVQRGAALVAMVVLAHQMPLSEFGDVVIQASVCALAAGVFGAGLEIPLIRAATNGDENEVARYRAGLVRLAKVGSSVAVVVLVVAVALRPIHSLWYAIPIECVSGAVFAALLYPRVVYARAQGHVTYAAVAGAAILIVPQATRVAACLVEPNGVTFALGGLAGHCILVPLHRRWVTGSVDATPDIRPGLPFLPHIAAHWVLALSDRLLVGALLGAPAVAVYGPNYQLAALVTVANTEVNRTATPYFASSSSATPALLRVSRRLLASQLTLAGAALVLIPLVSSTVLPPALHLDVKVVAVLVLGQVAYGAYFIAANELTLGRGDTRLYQLSATAAGLNVIANLVLVPLAGLAGAALATSLTYGVLALLAVVRVDASPGRKSIPSLYVATVAAGAVLTSVALTVLA